MKTKTFTLLTALLLVSISCHKPPPPPPPPPPPICEAWGSFEGCECPTGTEKADILGVCAPPRVDRRIDWGIARGVTSFSLALRDIEYVKDFTYHVQRHNWTVLRVGAWTAGDWCKPGSAGYLPCGPPYGSAQADANLIRLLEVTSRIHNIFIQVIPSFTYKSHNEGSQAANIVYFNAMFDHVNAIVKAGDYKHVVIEHFNEVEHPLSDHIKDEDVRAIFLHARARTDLPMGTDYHGGRANEVWRGRYPYGWRDVSDYLAFHTPRNPEPSFETMKAAQDKFRYIKPVWVDETVCYASQANIDKYGLKGKGTIAMMGHGTEAERWDQVVAHLSDIKRLGWVPFFHAIWLMECTELGRLPDYGQL